MNSAIRTIQIGSFLFLVAVILGASGAHAFEIKFLDTFKTGLLYHYLHAIIIMFLGLTEHHFKSAINLKFCKTLLLLGTLLFSGNCYLYALTGIKTFAHIVPVGGLCLILGHAFFIGSLQRLLKSSNGAA